MPDSEIITRRKLPHWYVPGAAHFVTYRLAGTIPRAVYEELRDRMRVLLNRKPDDGIRPEDHRRRIHKQFFAEYDRFLDAHAPIDWLAQPNVAAIIRGNLYHHNRCKYHLLAYCIMPNHVHALFQPIGPVAETGQARLLVPTEATGQARLLVPTEATGQARLLVPTEMEGDVGEIADARSPLSSIMHSLKSYTANEVNRVLGRSGQLWQHESYDHWVRDDDELERIVEYIRWNPVKAMLAVRPHEWLFCSAHDRLLQDGSEGGYLSADS